MLTKESKTNEMQISVLKTEVETATDFLFEQEQRMQLAIGMQPPMLTESLSQKLRMI